MGGMSEQMKEYRELLGPGDQRDAFDAYWVMFNLLVDLSAPIVLPRDQSDILPADLATRALRYLEEE
jgi:hypothetical protein